MAFANKLDYLYNNSNIVSISIISFIVLIFIDAYISSITDVTVDFIQSPSGISLFLFLFGLSLVGGFIILNNIFSILKEKKSIFSRYKNWLRIMQVAIYILSAVLLVDMLVSSKYSTINLTSIVIVSYGSTVLMSIFVSYKLFKWFGENRNKFSFIFGLSIFFLFVNNFVSILLFSTLLSEKSWEIDITTPVVFNFECDASSWYCFFKENVINIQSYTLMIYFAFFWLSNYLLLHYHIKKIGKIRFYTLITLPVILFYFLFIYHYDELYSLTETQNFDENLIFMLQIFIVLFSTALCGLLYGMGFKSVANLLSLSPNISRYLKMASYGIILLFITANGTIVGAALPPFGIPSIAFLPFASLLFYVGVYYSIIAISNDIKVKKYIKNSAYKELEIMGNLAHSQMMDSMKDRILNMTKKYSEELHQKDNSETMESEEDLKSYLDEAISIFKKKDKQETQ